MKVGICDTDDSIREIHPRLLLEWMEANTQY